MTRAYPTKGEEMVGYFIDSTPNGEYYNDIANGIKIQCLQTIDLLSHFSEIDIELRDQAQKAFVVACDLAVKLLLKGPEKNAIILK